MSGGFGLFVVIFVVFIALVVVAAIVQAKRARERRAAIMAHAASRGWGYSEADERWVDYFADTPFGLGHNRSAKNVLTGQFRGRDFVAFDYRYYTTETSTDSQGRSSSREVAHPHAVVAIQTGVVFPPLSVSPEGFFSRMAGRLTGTDIELESEDFNRAFTVKCTDRKFASDVLHPQHMTFLLAHRSLAFRFSGPWVLTTAPGEFELPDIEARLDYVATIVENIPDFIWKEARS